MPKEFRNPGSVFDIRFASWHRFDVLGIDQQQLKEPFQQVINRAPIHASTFHRYMGALELREPICQREQIGCHGTKSPGLFARGLAGVTEDDTRNHSLFVDIEPTATGINDLHRASPWM